MENLKSVLQIGFKDIFGGKFNGHTLQLALNERNITTKHLVYIKESDDINTSILPTADSCLDFINSLHIYNYDIIHLHLVHAIPTFKLEYLPYLSHFKPLILTIHDPWILGGHCIHHGACNKWKTICSDCEHLSSPIPLQFDTSSLSFELKKIAIQNSNISAIVASEWMQSNVAQSPIWAGKPVHLVPFGIDQKIFCPPPKLEDAKQALGIPPMLVLLARTQQHFKGLEILRTALEKLAKYHDFVLLTVGKNGLLPQLPKNILHKEYGWLTGDQDMVKLYQACDLFLMPSEQEAFGMMAIEAMSCGKMVLALDVASSALPWVIRAPHVGIAATQATYADELCRLASAPDEICHRGKLSLAYAREQYGHETYIQKILAVYKEAMAGFVLTDRAKVTLLQLQKNTPSITGAGSLRLSRYMRLKRHYGQYGALKTTTKILEKLRKKIIPF